MDKAQIASTIIISLIAATGGYLANRASSRASVKNVATSSRVEMEKEAYERARKMDTQTIERQDAELNELFEKQRSLNDDVKMVHRENDRLYGENRIILEDNARLRSEIAFMRQRILRIERGLHPDSTERIYERYSDTDTNPMMPETATDPMMREILDNGREQQ